MRIILIWLLDAYVAGFRDILYFGLGAYDIFNRHTSLRSSFLMFSTLLGLLAGGKKKKKKEGCPDLTKTAYSCTLLCWILLSRIPCCLIPIFLEQYFFITKINLLLHPVHKIYYQPVFRYYCTSYRFSQHINTSSAIRSTLPSTRSTFC